MQQDRSSPSTTKEDFPRHSTPREDHPGISQLERSPTAKTRELNTCYNQIVDPQTQLVRSTPPKTREVPSSPIYRNQSGAPLPHLNGHPCHRQIQALPTHHNQRKVPMHITTRVELPHGSLQQRRATLELERRPLPQLAISPPEHHHQRVAHPYITIKQKPPAMSRVEPTMPQLKRTPTATTRQQPPAIVTRKSIPSLHNQRATPSTILRRALYYNQRGAQLPQLKRIPPCHNYRGVCNQDLERSCPTTNKEWTPH